MRSMCVLFLLVVAGNLMADPVKVTFKVAGGSIGENVYDEKPDGSFTSTSAIKIGPTQIDTELTGQRENGKVVKLVIKNTTNGKTGTLAYDHGKVSAIGPDGKAIDLPDFKGSAFFSTFHPQIWRTLLPLPSEGKSVSAYVLDGARTAEMPFTINSPRDLNGEKLQSFSLEVAGIKIEVSARQNGTVVELNVPAQKFTGTAAGYESLLADPMAKFPELSQATSQTVKQLDVKLKMRDGVAMATDLTLPKDTGRHPAILVRTPYGRGNDTIQGDWWAQRGYVYVTQDVRGRGGSDGDWDPLVNERKDGADTIAWIAKQPWSNGKVGMIGGSYLGYVQWAAAIEQPPALKCIVPQVSPPPPFYNLPYENGAFFMMSGLWWSNLVKAKDADLTLAKTDLKAQGFLALPITKVAESVLGQDIPFYDRWIQRDRPSKWAGATTLAEIAKVKIPVLAISGSWDGDGTGTRLHWETLHAAGKTNQWVVFGPWEHGFNVKQNHLDVDYGKDSLIDLDSVYLRFFDTYLKDKAVNWQSTPKVKLFVTGANKWATFNDWPAADWKRETLYLAGASTGVKGDLVTKPLADKPSHYVYDPANIKMPVKSINLEATEGLSTKVVPGGGPLHDHPFFRSAAFPTGKTIAGTLDVTLYVSTTARDATFHALVLDEDDKGVDRMISIMGTMRATFADGTGIPKKLTPGKIYKITVRPWWFAHRFEPGHHLVVDITSSLFPIFARNPGTGEPDATATKLVRAVQTIYHDPQHPSHVSFEVLN